MDFQAPGSDEPNPATARRLYLRVPMSRPRRTRPAKAVKRSTSKPKKKATSTTKLVVAAKRSSVADSERGEALIAEILRRKARIAEDFYEIGEALRELLKKKLYLALGHATFGDMLKDRKLMGVTQAGKLIQLVSSVPREKALAIGSEKAFLLVDYAKATPEPDTAAWLLEEGKLPSGKRVADASTREIVAATKAVRAKQGTSKRKSSEQIEADKTARAVQAALRKRGVKGATVTAVKKGAEWLVRVEVTVAHAHALT